MIKPDLQCSYDGSQDFTEIHDPKHPNDSRYSAWECNKCHARFEDNPGYGYFTSFWGDQTSDTSFKFNPNKETGEESCQKK